MSFEPPKDKADLLSRNMPGKSNGQRLKRGFLKFAILELLTEQSRHGYEIIKELERRLAGEYRPSPGSIYPNLQALEEEGSLSSEEIEGKKIYTITESGRQALEAHQQHYPAEKATQEPLPLPLITGGPPDTTHIPEIKRSTIALMETIRYVAHFGTPEQVKELKKIIDSTSRQLHALLAREEDEIVP